MKEELLKIINHYGLNAQLKHFNSEVFELIEAILRYDSFDNIIAFSPGTDEPQKYFIHSIANEIADAHVMLEQFRNYFSIPADKVQRIMKQKVYRQLDRINLENTKKIHDDKFLRKNPFLIYDEIHEYKGQNKD